LRVAIYRLSCICKRGSGAYFFPVAAMINRFLSHICAMLQKLRQRWKVNGVNLALILVTFATGGSLCGYLGRKLLLLMNVEKGVLWVLLYIIFITLLWPLCVILISIPLGQFNFFRRYLTKMWGKMSGKGPKKPGSAENSIAIFASGAGSNAQQLIRYFKDSASVHISLVVCNKPGAGVLEIASKEGIPVLLIEKERFFSGDHYLPALQEAGISMIILAGFLWKVPVELIKAYPQQIVNIHPALLPLYGGKGMYGQRVHEAVLAAGDAESGISIHYVDELYDHGAVIFQARCAIEQNETAASLAAKIHRLEHEHFPKVVDDLLKAKG